jgi:hypothetical protein
MYKHTPTLDSVYIKQWDTNLLDVMKLLLYIVSCIRRDPAFSVPQKFPHGS